jgi:hypothetical protein
MFRVDDIYDEAKKIIGICDDTKLFRWCGDAVTLISNKADLEGWKGFIDICSAGCSGCDKIGSICNNPSGCGRRCITLPREVEMVIGVNIGGQPVLGMAQLFEFHLNGPGSCRTICEWKWMDQGGYHFTFRDLVHPAQLVAYHQTPEDNGKTFIVYGFDSKGNVLRHTEGGQVMNGYRVPTIYGVAVPDVGAPEIARITGIFKDRTVGNVRLSTTDDSGTTGTLLGIYEPDEQNPQYRRIQLNRSCNWARIAYRKTNPVFFSRFDHIALKSRVAFLLAMQARKHYADLQIADAHAYEADAARLEIEAQQMSEPPLFMPVQVIDMSNPRDKYDYDIR